MEAKRDAVFSGSIPRLYEELMVPMLFAPYAADLARQVAAREPARVLEIACGTGAVTRELAAHLPAATEIVATDLNPPMLELAQSLPMPRPLTWQQADALQLPFADAEFDAVVCQFGVMFFPDKPKGFAEARRVLRPGGGLLFNVWDTLATNAFVSVVEGTLAKAFPDDPPLFMSRTPHGYQDTDTILQHVQAGGFTSTPEVCTTAVLTHAPSAATVATAYCQGTPLRMELEARAPGRLAELTAQVEEALVRAFGTGPVEGWIQAKTFTVAR